MIITIFSKARTNAETGKRYYNYIGRLHRKDGTEQTVGIKFREVSAPPPDKCPMNILVSKLDSHLATREYNDPKTGELRTAYTLWVTAWGAGPTYVDTSLDDFDD